MTDAAAQLNITQPTLSRALARLEHQAGAALFDRVNRRLQLNSYGRVMLEHSRRSIAELREPTELIAALPGPDRDLLLVPLLRSMAPWFAPGPPGRADAPE